MISRRALALRPADRPDRLHLVRNAEPFPLVAVFGSDSLPFPVTEALARQCAAAPDAIAELINAARFFASHRKARAKAGNLPRQIEQVLREVGVFGWGQEEDL